MPQKKFSNKDLTNISRGFDAAPKGDHLERIREQAREIQRSVEKKQERAPQKDPTGLRKMFGQKKGRERDNERGRDGRS